MALSAETARAWATWVHDKQTRRTRLPERAVPGDRRWLTLAEARELEQNGGKPQQDPSDGRYYVVSWRTERGTEHVHDELASYTLEQAAAWVQANDPDAALALYCRGHYAGRGAVDHYGPNPVQQWLTLDGCEDARQIELARKGYSLVWSQNYTPEGE